MWWFLLLLSRPENLANTKDLIYYRPSVTVDDLKNLFAGTGCIVKAFKFFP